MYTLPDLPYAADALEPIIDAQTMRLHHDKHHAGYVNKLNEAARYLDDRPDVETLISHLDDIPRSRREAIRHNGGGHANHSMFWKSMIGRGKGGEPDTRLNQALIDAFGSFERFRDIFSAVAREQFGSGWAWLCMDYTDGEGLFVTSTTNQDNPLMRGVVEQPGIPILCLDLWEHAYYLRYENHKHAYIQAWWDVVNWHQVGRLYRTLLAEMEMLNK